MPMRVSAKIQLWGRSMRILVLEDDSQLGPWIADGLRKEGHVVDLFGDGKDALLAAMGQDTKILADGVVIPQEQDVLGVKLLMLLSVITQ